MSEEAAQVRIRGIVDPSCTNHPDTEAIVVCRNSGCDEALACMKCIVEGGCHGGHNLATLQDHMTTFKSKVGDFNKNTREQVLNPLKSKADKIASDLTTHDGTTSALLKEIEMRGGQLHSQIDHLVNEYKAKCSQIKASNRQLLEQYHHALLAKITEIEEDIASLDETIKGTCKADIIDAAKTRTSKTYPVVVYPNDVKEVVFQKSEMALTDMKRFLGRILIGNKHPRSEETDEEKIKQLEIRVQDLTQRKTSDAHEMTKMQKTIDDLREKLEQSSMQPQPQPTDNCQSCHGPKSSCTCITCPKCQHKGQKWKDFIWMTLNYVLGWRCGKCGHCFSL